MIPKDFELKILERMVDGYRASILKSIGKNQAWLEEQSAASDARFAFSQGTAVAEHVRQFGEDAEKEEPLSSEGGGVYLRHDFRLDIWPEMYWSLYSVDGLVYMCGFTRRESHRDAPRMFTFDARPGDVCLADIEACGSVWEAVDGWGERVLVRIRRAGEERLGTFVYALFQGWHEGAESDWSW